MVKHKGKKQCISEATWKANHRNHSEDSLLNPHGCFNLKDDGGKKRSDVKAVGGKNGAKASVGGVKAIAKR